MDAIRLGLIAVAALAMFAASAAAQAPARKTSPVAGPSCAAEVRKLQSSPELRVQGGTHDQVTRRAGAATFLQAAAQAAARHDEKTCREKLAAAQTLLGG